MNRCVASFCALAFFAAPLLGATKPNILWLSSEDNGPHLGAYGDDFATTPHLDALAKKGMIYSRAWSNAPVCAPARTAVISGLYPTSTGSQHMRSRTRLPEGFRFFPQLLREAGYYASNNAKEDYNLEKPGAVWDESSRQAHWRGRAAGQPFFSVFNFVQSHESLIRRRPHEARHDPDLVPLPPYHPDTPEVRQDWAQYYDQMTVVDAEIGQVLDELEKDGLAETTIVFYWGDHGVGLPRGKRTALNTGLHVPLIVSIPPAFESLAPPGWERGGVNDRLVGFVDFAPTVLRLAGIEPPAELQGRAFLGPSPLEPKPFLLGFRGRMDERVDLVRTLTDGRYVYSRSYLPDRPHGQHVWYQFQTPTTRVWYERWRAGELPESQSSFWLSPRPVEELYDLEKDPHEVRNLARSADHAAVLSRLRTQLRRALEATRDTGFLPEAELRRRTADRTPHELLADPDFPLAELLDAAELASAGVRVPDDAVLDLLRSEEPGLRYWGARASLTGGDTELAPPVERELELRLEDEAPAVAIAAAEALARSRARPTSAALEVLLTFADLERSRQPEVWQALSVLHRLGPLTGEQRARAARLPTSHEDVPAWAASYVPRLLEALLTEP
ncbi:MAG: sulfatase [Acidobacteriota bacterium]